MPVLRTAMLWLARQPQVAELVRSAPVTQPLVRRFVAGETLEEAVEAVRELNRRGMSATLDVLGENVTDEHEARKATETYRIVLDRIAGSGIDSTVSVKLTMLGLDLSDELCRENLESIVAHARKLGNSVAVDMESSAYTQRTLDLFYRLHPVYGDHIELVLQAYLYRTERDVRQAIERQARVRLVKGAYAEPPTVAYPSKRAVDAAYRRQMELLLEFGRFVAIATHDEAILRVAKGFARRLGIGREKFEFQMLYGVRRDVQEQLVREGYAMRVYVPFGRQWYPYFMRRLAERPANLLFALRQIAGR
ncbi:proline dehydrogenase family protein [Thermomicrobiaceae bacterium CFH 74404]|uniref:proline dehydrogenase n=1 Tax=Thermalbibacter longus TaxID=2951981 RepID=A0AA41WJ43_9BACT|nr:proline dehydrogenase family protein [Thermalbibacter longus]MCM8750321.1 proline dehydrogenase family protein [Thermalbibacter longus]